MSLPKRILLPLLIAFLFISSGPLTAESSPRGRDLTVSLMIIGPGKPLYVWWGHIGLIIENSREGTSHFYDFGNFSFEEENFYGNFAMGRLYYLKIKSRTEPYLHYMSWFDRWVHVYKLNLSSKEKETIYAILEEGVKPQNRTYLYHHYEDNCSTRIRDVLDEAMEGEIQEATAEYALSYRDQSNRFIRPFWPYMLVNFLQGSGVDQPISTWDALFLPKELEKFVLNHNRPDGDPFVTKTTERQDGIHPFIPDKPFPRGGAAFLWGMALFFITISIRLSRREGLGLFWRIFSLLAIALPGLFLCFMMFFTDHHVTKGNLNGLIACPILLGALIPAIRYEKHLKAPTLYRRFWDLQIILTLLSLLCQTLPGIGQDNLAVLTLFLPLMAAHGTAGSALVRLLSPGLRIYPWSRKL
ncbi:MAG: DUF4105 domain-containing protein [Spirochaetales bacterium]|nr:DUF4105 domain-containing protein [Spirochaetales bacterium]